MMNQIQRLNALKKHAKNFVAGPKEGRPIFIGIYYDKDGVAVVRNNYYLLQVEDVHSHKEPVILHHKTDEVIEGTYPITEGLWPSKFQAAIDIAPESLNIWIDYHAIAETVTKDNELKKVKTTDVGVSVLLMPVLDI